MINSAPLFRRDRATVTLVAVAFAVLTLVNALQLYIARVTSHETATLIQVLLSSSAAWMIWALFAPGILWLGRHFDFRRGRRATSVGAHILGLLCCHLPSALLSTWLGYALFSPDRPPTAAAFRQALLLSSRLQLSVLVYATILGVGYAVHLWDTLRQRELQASRLEAQAARARLEALATRLQPHFLFNTLHAIGALIDENPRLARAMLVQLGDLLRDVLADVDAIEVTLQEELALLQRYLDIEQIRFADRLRADVEAADGTLDILVPRLMLQPLVENALRHGLAPKATGGQLRVMASSDSGHLTLVVWNDGVPLTTAVRDGIGLATTRERLRARYGDGATLTLRTAVEGGVETVIVVPVVRGSP